MSQKKQFKASENVCEIEEENGKLFEGKQPKFLSPLTEIKYITSTEEVECETIIKCASKVIPNDVILIHPKQKEIGVTIYDKLVDKFKEGKFREIAKGKKGDFYLLTSDIKTELQRMVGDISNLEITAIHPSREYKQKRILQIGDILIKRVGKKGGVGKPFFILEEVKKEK